MAQDWNIRSRGDACRECGGAFADGDAYISALVLGAEGYVRADYHDACWENVRATVIPYSQWQGTYRVPPPEPEEPLKKETAESLLRRLIEDADEAHINVCFILAVMLERNRTFVERDVKRDEEAGLTTRVYEHRKTGETFLITDPHLRLDELESVQEEVIAMLEGGPRHPEA